MPSKPSSVRIMERVWETMMILVLVICWPLICQIERIQELLGVGEDE